jgi:Oxidoreductase family, NAD-binding Rossmann fold
MSNMTRRDLLKAGLALGTAGSAIAFPDDKVRRVGLIGCGWYGKGDLLRLVQVSPIEVASLCDVDSKMLSDAADLVSTRQRSKKKPRMFSDYREMLKQKDLDIVLVGTPDHWHALAMIAAVQSGVDVWVQKPISVDIVEGQAMVAAARGAGGNAAPQHAASGRSARSIHQDRAAGQDCFGGHVLLLPHARDRQSSRYDAACEPGLRNVDRTRAHASL